MRRRPSGAQPSYLGSFSCSPSIKNKSHGGQGWSQCQGGAVGHLCLVDTKISGPWLSVCKVTGVHMVFPGEKGRGQPGREGGRGDGSQRMCVHSFQKSPPGLAQLSAATCSCHQCRPHKKPLPTPPQQLGQLTDPKDPRRGGEEQRPHIPNSCGTLSKQDQLPLCGAQRKMETCGLLFKSRISKQ